MEKIRAYNMGNCVVNIESVYAKEKTLKEIIEEYLENEHEKSA